MTFGYPEVPLDHVTTSYTVAEELDRHTPEDAVALEAISFSGETQEASGNSYPQAVLTCNYPGCNYNGLDTVLGYRGTVVILGGHAQWAGLHEL
jgi:hypothetical protein